jgi:hypothetical protein
LVSCYRAASTAGYGAEAAFTTHATGRFTGTRSTPPHTSPHLLTPPHTSSHLVPFLASSGTLDYIWCSEAHFHVSDRITDDDDSDDYGHDGGGGGVSVLEIPTQMLEYGAAAYMPNQHCPSDHLLPLAADIPLRSQC